MPTTHAKEVYAGERFSFGDNWAQFLKILNEDRILQAQNSLTSMLKMKSLEGKRFLDIGSGSGLFSLAARKLGATVHSIDYDPQSVACTEELKRKYFPDDSKWTVEAGSALDEKHLSSLGLWDVVYSWGVLHHTGNLNQALNNASKCVAPNGKFFIAIYNDQGWGSGAWLTIKKAYNRLPPFLRWMVLWPSAFRLWGPTMIKDLLKGKPFHTWRNYPKESLRGMSPWRDVVDWVGGLPFEVASPQKIRQTIEPLGFQIETLKTCGKGHGCNEFIFLRK